MKALILHLLFLISQWPALAQQTPLHAPLLNVRASFLAFPFTPLLSLELRLLPHLTMQAETNFWNVHGLNFKAYAHSDLNGPYFFVGNAWVKHRALRQDGGFSILPYTGVGYAVPFGVGWRADVRLGAGPMLFSERKGVYPVLKFGIGKWII